MRREGAQRTFHLGASEVHGGRVGRRPRADDDNLAVHSPGSDRLKFARARRVLSETGS